jgi:hypothetical protein
LTTLRRDDPTSTLTLWAGEQVLMVGATEADARSAGANHPVQVRADAAIVWALAGSGADLVLTDEELVDLLEGIGGAAAVRTRQRHTTGRRACLAMASHRARPRTCSDAPPAGPWSSPQVSAVLTNGWPEEG